MEETLEKLLLKAMEIAEKTGEFAIEQAPDLLREFYMWHIASAIFYIIIAIGLFIGGFFLLKYFTVNINGENSNEGAVAISFVGLMVGFSVGTIMFFINLYDLLFILVAPKLYLIQWFIK